MDEVTHRKFFKVKANFCSITLAIALMWPTMSNREKVVSSYEIDCLSVIIDHIRVMVVEELSLKVSFLKAYCIFTR